MVFSALVIIKSKTDQLKNTEDDLHQAVLTIQPRYVIIHVIINKHTHLICKFDFSFNGESVYVPESSLNSFRICDQ